MPAWRQFRDAVERITHEVFCETGKVYPTTGIPFDIVGELFEFALGSDKNIFELTPEFGAHSFSPFFELRKDADTGPHTVEQFPVKNGAYGTFELFSRSVKYQIVYVVQNSSMIYIGLGNFKV